MKNLQVQPIGTVVNEAGTMAVQLDSKFIEALAGLAGFSHLQLLWWFSDFDNEEARNVLQVPQPYKNAPEIMGIFATRSPVRPNPVALTTVEVISLDQEKGLIEVSYLDAHHGSPVLDLKPYTPSADRVEQRQVPTWCQHWPQSFESSGDFDWEKEFMF